MNNPYKLTVTLRQHTHLLHFQHAQAGATLRASEVKPRLDDFIRKQREIDFPAQWRIGKEKGQHLAALDYSLWISASETPERVVIKTIFSRRDKEQGITGLVGSYFGGAEGLLWRNGLTLTFSSFETEILDTIYQYIVPFFVLHNFGQRQTKGFGSFTVSHINGQPLQGYQNGLFASSDFEKILRQSYTTVYRLNEPTATPPLERIHREYQLLKSGQNNPQNANEYRKSKLFEYFIHQPSPLRWEKRKIKQEIKSITGRGSYPFMASLKETRQQPIDIEKATDRPYNAYADKQENSYRYVRVLLGLAENNEYQTMGGDPNYLVHIKHLPVSGNEKDKIERLASPILFKVFTN